MSNQLSRRDAFLLCMLTLIWGLNWPVMKIGVADFPAFNQTYASYFTGDPPARSTVQVAALPKGARVEVEAVALLE